MSREGEGVSETISGFKEKKKKKERRNDLMNTPERKEAYDCARCGLSHAKQKVESGEQRGSAEQSEVRRVHEGIEMKRTERRLVDISGCMYTRDLEGYGEGRVRRYDKADQKGRENCRIDEEEEGKKISGRVEGEGGEEGEAAERVEREWLTWPAIQSDLQWIYPRTLSEAESAWEKTIPERIEEAEEGEEEGAEERQRLVGVQKAERILGIPWTSGMRKELGFSEQKSLDFSLCCH